MRNSSSTFLFGLLTVSVGKYEFVNLSLEPLCKVLAFNKHLYHHGHPATSNFLLSPPMYASRTPNLALSNTILRPI